MYISVPDTINRNREKSDFSQSMNENNCENNCYFRPINALEVKKKIINSLKKTNSKGDDDMTSRCLKNVAFYISDVLAFIFNRIIEEDVFPEQIKSATIIRI